MATWTITITTGGGTTLLTSISPSNTGTGQFGDPYEVTAGDTIVWDNNTSDDVSVSNSPSGYFASNSFTVLASPGTQSVDVSSSSSGGGTASLSSGVFPNGRTGLVSFNATAAASPPDIDVTETSAREITPGATSYTMSFNNATNGDQYQLRHYDAGAQTGTIVNSTPATASSGAFSIALASTDLPASGTADTKWYSLYARRPTANGGDNQYDYCSGTTLVNTLNLTRRPLNPTITISDDDAESANVGIIATIGDSNTFTADRLVLVQYTGASAGSPDSQVTALRTDYTGAGTYSGDFTQPRNTGSDNYFYRAYLQKLGTTAVPQNELTGSSFSDYDPSNGGDYQPGYIAPGSGVSVANQVISSNASALSVPITGGISTKEAYTVSLTSGLASANVVSNSIDTIIPYDGSNFSIPAGNLPTSGNTTTYYVYGARYAANGGDGFFDEIDSFTITNASGSFSVSSNTVTEGGSITVSNISTSPSGNYSLRLWRVSGDSPDDVTNTQINFTGTSRANYSILFNNQTASEIGYQGETFDLQLQLGSIGVAYDTDVLAEQQITLYDDEDGTSVSPTSQTIGSGASTFSVTITSNWSGTNNVAARIRNTTSNTVVDTFTITTNNGDTVRNAVPSPAAGTSANYRVEVFNGNEYLNGATFSVTRSAAIVYGGAPAVNRNHGNSEWICMEGGTIGYACMEPSTVISTRTSGGSVSTVLTTGSAPQRGTFTGVTGNAYYANKPFTLNSSGFGHRMVPKTMIGKEFGDVHSRGGTATYYFWSASATNVAVWDNVTGGLSGTPTSTFSMSANTVTTFTRTAQNTNRILFASDNPMVMSKAGATNDRHVLEPASDYVYYRRASYTIAMDNAGASTSTGGTNGGVAYDTTDRVAVVAIGDGAGGDSEHGVGDGNISNTYLWPWSLRDFVLTSPNNQTIVVDSYNSGWVERARYTLTGTTTSPGTLRRDGDSGFTTAGTNYTGSAATFNSDTLWRFRGSNNFHIALNDNSTDEESGFGFQYTTPTPSKPTDISFSDPGTVGNSVSITCTATGGSGNRNQVSEDNSTWFDSPQAFTFTRGSAKTIYARAIDGPVVSATPNYSESFTPTADSQVTPFTFTDQANAALSTAYYATMQVTGINVSSVDVTTTSGVGTRGFYVSSSATPSTTAGDYTTTAKTASLNQYVHCRVVSSATASQGTFITIAVGSPAESDTFNVTTAQDTAPDDYNFTDQSSVNTNTLILSNIETITGITGSVSVSVSGSGSPQIKINGGSPTTSGSIQNNQTLQCQLTSSSANSDTRTATVTLGTGTYAQETWSVTTLASGSGGGGAIPGGSGTWGIEIYDTDGTTKVLSPSTRYLNALDDVTTYTFSATGVSGDTYDIVLDMTDLTTSNSDIYFITGDIVITVSRLSDRFRLTNTAQSQVTASFVPIRF